MKWTKAQQEAIDARGADILVSAAAGSGKTAVMVERVTKMIVEEKISLDQMLIVTFTNAAAAEMKEKIRRAIRKKAREALAAGDEKEAAELKDQLDLMPRAQISTFHSFALEVIRRFFYLTDQEPGFRICDESRGILLQEEALDELLDQAYEEKDPAFLAFMDQYSSEKSDDRARRILLSVYKKIMALPDPWSAVREAADQLREPVQGTAAWGLFWNLAEEEVERILTALRTLLGILADSGQQKLEASYSLLYQQILDLKGPLAARDMDAMKAALEAIGKFPQLRSQKKFGDFDAYKDQAKACQKEAKDVFADLRDRLFRVTLAEWASQRAREADAAEELIRLLTDFHGIFAGKKRDQGLLDFSDIEHRCLEILAHEEAAAFYQEKFKAVFIDEYQDTNVIQEIIVDRVRKPGTLFMVGDVKQSIYKFRLAEPEIFMDKYRRYAEAMAAGETGVRKIDLNQNFRSRPGILRTINQIFQPIMPGYDEAQALHPGLVLPDGCQSGKVELHVLSKQEEKELTEESGNGDAAAQVLREMRAEEREARLAALIIRKNVGQPFYDTKTGEVRPLRYRDMVILLRSVVSSGLVYRNVMKEMGIPLYLDDNKGLFDRTEVHVFLNLLRVIDNRYQDVPLLSVLRSEIFGFTTDELAEIRLRFPDLSYARAFFSVCGDEGEREGEGEGDRLAAKCRSARDRLRRWKRLSSFLPLPDFLWRVLEESRYYLMVGAMPEGAQRQANLRVILDRSEDYSREQQGSLYTFLRYIDNLRTRSAEVGQARLLGEQDDVVRLMTVHKSKGLEFPLVIMGGMGRRFVMADKDPNIDFHKDIGLALTLEEPDRHLSLRTLDMDLIKAKERAESLAEEVRILYVGLTRARDQLYMLGSGESEEDFRTRTQSGVRKGDSFLGLLAAPLPPVVFDRTPLPKEKPGKRPDPAGDQLFAGLPSPALKKKVFQMLDYRYPHEEAAALRSKYSVTALNRMLPEALEEREGYYPGTGPFPAGLPGEGGGPEAAAGPAGISAGAGAGAEAGGSWSDGEANGYREGGSAGAGARFEVPLFLQEEKPLTAAERGIVFHGLMERIDPVRCQREGRPYLKALAESLVKAEIFTEKEMAAVPLEAAEAFFRTDMGGRVARAGEAGKLWREEPFDLAITLRGEEVGVQGIIDCFFEEDGGLVLLDYKTNRIDPRKPFGEEADRIRDMYRVQVQMYARALEEGTGKPVREAALYLVQAGALVEMPLGGV